MHMFSGASMPGASLNYSLGAHMHGGAGYGLGVHSGASMPGASLDYGQHGGASMPGVSLDYSLRGGASMLPGWPSASGLPLGCVMAPYPMRQGYGGGYSLQSGSGLWPSTPLAEGYYHTAPSMMHVFNGGGAPSSAGYAEKRGN
jgi:hypothetical protein